jgi:hypothetical protein
VQILNFVEQLHPTALADQMSKSRLFPAAEKR